MLETKPAHQKPVSYWLSLQRFKSVYFKSINVVISYVQMGFTNNINQNHLQCYWRSFQSTPVSESNEGADKVARTISRWCAYCCAYCCAMCILCNVCLVVNMHTVHISTVCTMHWRLYTMLNWSIQQWAYMETIPLLFQTKPYNNTHVENLLNHAHALRLVQS